MNDRFPHEILAMFCTEDRESLALPFLLDGYAYATDGHVLVRCPADFASEVQEVDIAPVAGVRGLTIDWTTMDDVRQTERFPEAVRIAYPTWNPDACAECSGYGSLVHCPECKDRGRVSDDCRTCSGFGSFGSDAADAWRCHVCHGLGVSGTSGHRTIEVQGSRLTEYSARLILNALPGAWFRAAGGYIHFSLGIFRGICLGVTA